MYRRSVLPEQVKHRSHKCQFLCELVCWISLLLIRGYSLIGSIVLIGIDLNRMNEYPDSTSNKFCHHFHHRRVMVVAELNLFSIISFLK